MDECNRLLRTDVDFEPCMMHVPGTKTAESECYLPMSPALQQELKTYLAMRTDTSPYLLPERSAQAKGKKIYSRRRLFEKIKRTTAFNVCTATMKAWKELKKDNYPGGVKLSTKELRDYFATQVSARLRDPNTVKNLMRHTSLNTTSRYTRTVVERMTEAVQNLGKPLGASLGGNSGGKSQPKYAQIDDLRKLAMPLVHARAGVVSDENNEEKSTKLGSEIGGRSRNRTYDLAHVRRAL